MLATGERRSFQWGLTVAKSPTEFKRASWLYDAKALAKFRLVLLPGPRRVLITGGSPDGSSGRMLKSADLYDPATNRFEPTQDMIAARHSHISIPVSLRGGGIASSLRPEQTLVAGGLGVVNSAGDTAFLATAEIFSEGRFHAIADMNAARAGAVAAMTSSGRILVAGGRGYDPAAMGMTSAEYLRATNAASFEFGFERTAGDMVYERALHTATPVRVLARRFPAILITGGGDNTANWTAEVYVAQDDDFGVSAPIRMRYSRVLHAAALLNDGRVLVCGGARSSSGTDLEWNQAELFDPMALTFSEFVATGNPPPSDYRRVGQMNEPRQGHSATALPDGRVLIAGGSKTIGSRAGQRVGALVERAEIFDPTTLQFTLAASLATPRQQHTATALGDGRVLVAGGYGAGVAGSGVLDSGEIYDPSNDTFTPVGNTMSSRRVFHAAAPI